MHVKTIAKRFRRGLKAIADWCKQHRHDPGGAAEDPQRQAPRSLPVLRAPHELPQSMAVLPEGPTYLA